MSPEHQPVEDGGLFESIFTSDEVAQATSDRAWLEAFLEVELALARALESSGMARRGSAQQLASRLSIDGVDPVRLGRSGRDSGNPVIPFLSHLRGQLEGEAEELQAVLHRGATSQDILDSAFALVARHAVRSMAADLEKAVVAAIELARQHRSTVQLARTLMRPAVPSTFGLRAVGWASAIADSAQHLLTATSEIGAQLGGAAGTLASLGDKGIAVRQRFAEELDLPLSALPWQADRQAVARLGSALAIACGTAAKIGRDVALLSMPEIGELTEGTGEGRGGSSTMPQKDNPVRSVLLVANGRRAAGLATTSLGAIDGELDRAAGAWQSEWTAVNGLLRAAGGSARTLAALLEGLQVFPDKMRENLSKQPGVFAERLRVELTDRLGYGEATKIVGQIGEKVREGSDYVQAAAEVLKDRPDLEAVQQEALFETTGYLGAAEALLDEAAAALSGSMPEG